MSYTKADEMCEDMMRIENELIPEILRLAPALAVKAADEQKD
jgi:hypothetical protein